MFRSCQSKQSHPDCTFKPFQYPNGAKRCYKVVYDQYKAKLFLLADFFKYFFKAGATEPALDCQSVKQLNKSETKSGAEAIKIL